MIIAIISLICIALFVEVIQEHGKQYTQGIIKGKFINHSTSSETYGHYLMVEYDYTPVGHKTPVKKTIKVRVTRELYDKVGIDVFFTVKVNV